MNRVFDSALDFLQGSIKVYRLLVGLLKRSKTLIAWTFVVARTVDCRMNIDCLQLALQVPLKNRKTSASSKSAVWLHCLNSSVGCERSSPNPSRTAANSQQERRGCIFSRQC